MEQDNINISNETLEINEPQPEQIRRKRANFKNLTLDERRMLKLYLSGEANSLHDAALKIGKSESWANHKPYVNQHIKNYIQQYLEKHGLDDDAIFAKLKSLLEAAKPYWNPKTKQWDFFPDNEVQKGSLHMALKVADKYPSEKIDINQAHSFTLIIQNKNE